MPKKVLIEFNGKIASVAEHCKDLGINVQTAYSKHKNTDKSYEEILEYYQKNGVKYRNCDYKIKNKKLYKKWCSTKQKCENPKHPAYKWYGERGIKLCERWQVYENFENDLLESFLDHVEKYGLKNTQIERIDYNGDYEPSNVTWATCKEQQNNKSNNRMVTEELNVAQFADMYNIPYATVLNQLNRGWSINRIITQNKNKDKNEKCKIILPTGETLTEVSKRTGIPRKTLESRIHRGWALDKVISEPLQEKYSKNK